jgi:hypothetical protein
MKLASNDAFELAKLFRALSQTLGDYRLDQWTQLTPAQRQLLEDAEWSLLSNSSDIRTRAVGLVLDESAISFAALKESTSKARKAVEKLAKAHKAIKIAIAAVGLAAAVMARDPGAIASNAAALVDAATASS